MKRKYVFALIVILVSLMITLGGCDQANADGVEQESNAQGCLHTWNPATCDMPKTCTICGETEGDALGHAWADATCTTPKTCSVCQKTEGAVTSDHVWTEATCIDPKTCSVCRKIDGRAEGHGWEKATCTAAKTCSKCGEAEGKALGHVWEDATCTKPKTCSDCGETEGRALNHNWGNATCTKSKTCLACGAIEGTALGHVWGNATCTKPKNCLSCGETEGMALGHDWKNATCTKPKMCITCGETDGAALGHDWQNATCTVAKTCLSCGEIEGRALGHTWDAATCTKPKTCSVCAETDGRALGHTWLNATCVSPETCSACDETKGSPLGHDYRESVAIAASCKADGTMKYTCNICTDTYTKSYAFPVYSASEIHTMTEASVGEIITYDKNGYEYALGTGFVMSADGKIITNYHVIEGACDATITINGIVYPVQYVLAYDKDIDLAVLKITASGLKPMKICQEKHTVGMTVYAFGSSQGLTATFSSGIITYAERQFDGVRYVQHDAAISQGNSGGPLINQHGEVIGINTLTVSNAQNLNLAVSACELSNLSYDTPCTLYELYEKENDTFTRFSNHIIQYGTYYPEDNQYFYYGGSTEDTDARIIRGAYYDVERGEIRLYILYEYQGSSFLVVICIDEIDGVYTWAFTDDYGYHMMGTIYASTFGEDTLLSYYSTDYSSSDISTVRSLASTMVHIMCTWINTDYAYAGVTAVDLGFYNYEYY